MSPQKLLTQSDILAAFPPAPVPIVGEMTLREIIRIWVHMMACAQTQKWAPDPTLNFLYLACPETLWGNYSNDAYPQTPPHPGQVLHYPAGSSTAECANLKAIYEWHMKNHMDPQEMDTSLVTHFLTLIPLHNKTEYQTRKLSNPNESFLQCVMWFTEKYGDTAEPEREDNRNRMKKTWQLHDGWLQLQQQIEEGQVFAAVIGQPIPDTDAVDMAITVLMKTGLFPAAYEEWHARPDGTKPGRM